MWSIFSRDPASSFPFEILELLAQGGGHSIWNLHRGKKKQGGDEVSIFVCESHEQNSVQIELAKASVKRLKTLRHPNILTYIDSLEKEKLVYLATEPVLPLLQWMQQNKMNHAHKSSLSAWGLLQVMKSLSFLNNDGGLTHFNVCCHSIFVTHGGEWKLGGFEYSSNDSSYYPVKASLELRVYDPAEQIPNAKMKSSTRWSPDMWGMGCLIWETFNGCLTQSTSLRNTMMIPSNLVATYGQLIGTNPSARPNPQDLLLQLRQPGQFFSADIIETLLFLDEIQIKDDTAKHRFFSDLTGKLENIPDFVAKNKILPALTKAYEFSNVGSVIILPLFKISKLLNENEYQQNVLPIIVKMFSSNDRATRLKLLQQIEDLVEHMNPKTVDEQIFPHLSQGFLDTNPSIREQSVKAILHLAPKLNYNNINVEVLKHFARLQAKDDQGGIRANTTICLGKIAMYLHPTTRKKCLISAFTRAMKDPFPPSRSAGVMGLAATQQYYDLTDVASRILPALSCLTMDPEKSVRDSVFKIIKGFLGKLEKVSEDPSLREQMESEVNSTSIRNSTQTASSWANWAMGTLTSKFYKSIGTAGTHDNIPKESITLNVGRTEMENNLNSNVPLEDSLPKSKDTNTNWESLNSKPGEPDLQHTSLLDLLDGNDLLSGDAWEDEEWGSLENAEVPVIQVQKAEAPPKISVASRPTSSYKWTSSAAELVEDDFFSLISGNIPNKKTQTYMKDSNNLIDLRNEDEIQPKLETGSKRTARTGPMKLGTRKA